MSTSVQAAREALGTRLRELRKDARLSGRQLAELCEWHFTKVSKIEHGTTAPSDADLELWCLHCRAESQLPDLLATSRGIEKMYVELRRLMRAGAARYQREILASEMSARRYRVFTMFMIPGALQTRPYATVRLSEFSDMTQTPADVEQAVDARMERGRLIRSGERMFHFVMCEAALRTAMATPEVMAEQLAYLIEASRLPRVHLGVVPTSVRQYMPLCEFWIFDDAVVETETYSAAIRMEQPGEIAMYARVFDHYARVAVYGDAARDLIQEALGEWEQLRATN